MVSYIYVANLSEFRDNLFYYLEQAKENEVYVYGDNVLLVECVDNKYFLTEQIGENSRVRKIRYVVNHD